MFKSIPTCTIFPSSLLKNAKIPVGGAIEVIQGKVVIKDNDKIKHSVKEKFKNQLNELEILALILNKKKTEALKIILKRCSLLKKLRFFLFLMLPNKILKKLVNR